MIKFPKPLVCALVISTFFVSSCVQREPTSGIQSPISAEGAIKAIRDYHAAWEALDFGKVTAFHTDDFEYLFFTELVEADAFPEILSESWMAGVIEYEINEDAFRVLIIEPNHAHVSLQVSDRSIYADGSVARTVGSMTYLLRKENDWKIQRLHHAGPAPHGLYDGENSD